MPLRIIDVSQRLFKIIKLLANTYEVKTETQDLITLVIATYKAINQTSKNQECNKRKAPDSP